MLAAPDGSTLDGEKSETITVLSVVGTANNRYPLSGGKSFYLELILARETSILNSGSSREQIKGFEIKSQGAHFYNKMSNQNCIFPISIVFS